MPHLQALPHIPPKLSRSPTCSGTGVVLLCTSAPPKSSLSSSLLPLSPTFILALPFQTSGNQPLPPKLCQRAKNIMIHVGKTLVSSAFPGKITSFSRSYIPISKVQPVRKQLLTLQRHHTLEKTSICPALQTTPVSTRSAAGISSGSCTSLPVCCSFQSCSVNSLSPALADLCLCEAAT